MVTPRDLHDEYDEFWLLLDSNQSTVTYGHQLGSRVLLRIAGVDQPVEHTMIVPNAVILPVDGDNGEVDGLFKLVAFECMPNIFDSE